MTLNRPFGPARSESAHAQLLFAIVFVTPLKISDTQLPKVDKLIVLQGCAGAGVCVGLPD